MLEPVIEPADIRLVEGRPRAFRRHGDPHVVTHVRRSWPTDREWWQNTARDAEAPDLPNWTVEAVDPYGTTGLYDIHIDRYGQAHVSAHDPTDT